MRKRKHFLKKSKNKLYRLSQGRALRLKRLKQRKTLLFARHSLQFVLQEM